MESELTAASKRDPFFDNARFLLVALVVLGHMISPIRAHSEVVYFANNFLMSFRMPALILITGYFSKRYYRDHFLKKVTIGILVPYLLFQSFYSLMNDIIFNHEEWKITILFPSFAMWFLLSLFFWNVLLLIFSKMKHPIIIAFLIGIGIGWLDNAGHYLSISRTFVFFPFFLIGHYLQPKHFAWMKKDSAKLISLISIACSWLILLSFSLSEAREFLLGRYPYIEIAGTYADASVIRMVFYVVMLLGILAFLPWVPSRQTFFTQLGRRTAYVYLLHIFFIKLLKLLDISAEPTFWYMSAVSAAWLAIVFLTSSTYLVKVMRPFVEGRIALFLFRENATDNQHFPRNKAPVYITDNPNQ